MFGNFMFKTDEKSLEKMSFDLDTRDISNLRMILEYFRGQEFLTISEKDVTEALSGLSKIGKLKLEGRLYAFHVDDSWAQNESGEGNGVEVYLRQGDILRDFYVACQDYVYSAGDAAHRLNEAHKPIVYTGDIPEKSDFLGIEQKSEDGDGDIIVRTSLEDGEVRAFEGRDIKVIRLDSLI
jgi:hypothetical protein